MAKRMYCFAAYWLEHLNLVCRRKYEAVRLFFVVPRQFRTFYIVSSERNVGEATLKCLDSVYAQHYPRHLIRHIFIDDASSDSTHDMILKWLHENPDHNVDYIHNEYRVGGCANNLKGFHMASPGSIVCELNGDDWLPDTGVISYLNKVYEAPEVWMTYNTVKTSEGRLIQPTPIPQDIIKTNSFRENGSFGRHLHTFRQELFTHLREESLVDPETGEYFISGDDKAFYIPLQELAGRHSRHLYRITYVYNFDGTDPEYGDVKNQKLRTGRILHMPRYEPLNTLTPQDTDRA